MPNVDPVVDAMTPREQVEKAAEPVNPLVVKQLTDAMRSVLDERFAAERAEMYEEILRRSNEAAQAVVAGKNEAPKTDADNELAPDRDYVRQFTAALNGLTDEVRGQRAAQPEVWDAKAKVKALARAAYYLHHGEKSPSRALALARDSKETPKAVDFMARALGADTFAAGGALIQGEMSQEVIPELLSDTVYFGDGDMPPAIPRNGTYTQPYIDVGPTDDHHAESVAVNASQPTFDDLQLIERKDSVIVPASKDLMRLRSGVESIIINAMRRVLQDGVDLAMIRSTGASDEPIGLRYKADSSNILNVNGTVSVANTIEDILRLHQATLDQNVPHDDSGRMAFAPRTWRYLMQLQGTGTNYLFQQEMTSNNSVFGVKIAGRGRGVQNIPTNLAVTDTNESEIYFYYLNHLLFGIADNMTLTSADQASYNDSTGAHVSAFSRREVLWRLDYGYDFACTLRGKSIAVLSDVDWS